MVATKKKVTVTTEDKGAGMTQKITATASKAMIPILTIFAAIIGVIASWVFALSRDQSNLSNRVTQNEVKVEVLMEVCDKMDERFQRVENKIDVMVDKLNNIKTQLAANTKP